jgi:protein-S-isoprenylcysteine O-methyltransferase Ste14
MIDIAVLIIWTCHISAWTVLALNTKRTIRRESRWRCLAFLVGPFLILWLLMTTPWLALHNQVLWPRWMLSAPIRLGGVLILAAGVGLAIWSRVILGRNWSATVTLKQDHELIQRGPYKIARHPIYTGILLGFVGTAVAEGLSILWIGLCVAVAVRF